MSRAHFYEPQVELLDRVTFQCECKIELIKYVWNYSRIYEIEYGSQPPSRNLKIYFRSIAEWSYNHQIFDLFSYVANIQSFELCR